MALLFKYDLPTLALVLPLIAVVAFFTYSLFNLKRHPLSRFPGPRIWACSRLPYVLSLQNGTLHAKLKALHDIYGPVVRVAPNELSFIEPEAWKNIYCDGFGCGEIYYGMLGPNSIIGASPADHGRMRDALNPAFRPSAIRGYENNMRFYMHLLVEQLGVVAKNKSCDGSFDTVDQDEVMVDIVRWLNFTTFDVVANIVYGGEPFGCLRRGEFHPWVGLMFVWLKAANLFVALRYYTPLDRLLLWLVPPGMTKQKEEFDRLGRERVRKQFLSAHNELDGDGVEDKKEYDRASPSNILSHLKSGKSGAIMTLAEMEVSLTHIVIAGSETVATMLSGTINYLCQNASALKTLTDEVRSASPHEEGLTIANLSQLPYLTAVIKEGLRITSPSPMSFPRIVPAEGAMIADYWVPGHTIVAVNQFAASRSATHFYKPLAFMPERWLDSAVQSSLPFASDTRDASRNFGGGAGDCIGQGIAWAEMRLILANLVWAFDIEAVRVVDWAQQRAYIIWQKKPFEVRLRRRVSVQGEKNAVGWTRVE